MHRNLLQIFLVQVEVLTEEYQSSYKNKISSVKIATYKISQLLDRFENDFLMSNRLDSEFFELIRPQVQQLLAVNLIVVT